MNKQDEYNQVLGGMVQAPYQDRVIICPEGGWLAVDGDYTLHWYEEKPIRGEYGWIPSVDSEYILICRNFEYTCRSWCDTLESNY